MSQPNQHGPVLPWVEVEVRVRYSECDPMNVAHHSVYPIWMEIARTDLLRRGGTPYRELEERGILFVVARMSLRYHKPARYDDVLKVRCAMKPSAGIKIDHEYRVTRGDDLLTTAETTIVCVNREGKAQPVPQGLIQGMS